MTFRIIQILLLPNGLGIAVIWTRYILTHPEIDHPGNFFSARDNESGTLFWSHWLAEYSTSLLLVVSPVLIFFKVDYGNQLLPFAAGALFYTALNSLGRVFARKERFVYAVPMLFALATSFIYFFFLILS